jgi:hypothetical protein
MGTQCAGPVSKRIGPFHYALWRIWGNLIFLQRLFCLVLLLVGIYTLFSSATIAVRVRLLSNRPQTGSAVATLRAWSVNLHQLLDATFYLFGLVFFFTLPSAFNSFVNSHIPAGNIALRNFGVDFIFAANVFLVLLFLHGVQWFAAARLNAARIALEGS